jgi:chromosome segregation ATPase
MSRDHTDLVIAELADSEARLLERVVDLEGDLSVYRELLSEALTALRAVTATRDRLRQDRERLREDLQRLREQTMRQAAAA